MVFASPSGTIALLGFGLEDLGERCRRSRTAISVKPMEYIRTRKKDRRGRSKLPCRDHNNRSTKTDRRRVPDRRAENIVEDR